MRRISIALIIAGILILALGAVLAQDGDMTVSSSTADHSKFEELQGPFESGPEVTAACLSCHTEAATQVQDTVHWTWSYEDDSGETFGKLRVVNNYCVAVESNEPRCTSCHTGYGWRDDGYDFAEQTNVDCLVCHDTTGTYEKFPTGAGFPVSEPTDFGGRTWEPPDYALVAQNIGATSRDTCGSCHFTGGGGDAVKHGDMDTSLGNPAYELDVHMSPDGADFTCATCHATEAHNIAGGRYNVTAFDENGIDYPGHDDGNPATCESCHGFEPHEIDLELDGQEEAGDRLNRHGEFIACQTCHIPEYARAQPTKMTWDWSTAGELNDEGGLLITRDEETGVITYDSRKGGFTWEANVQPDYLWLTGEFDFMTLGETIDPSEMVYINEPELDTRRGRLYPVKTFVGIQPYDSVNNTLIVPHLFPYGPDDQTAFWRVWDFDLAFAAGMEDAELDYSGEYDFVETTMYWPITHMVAPSEEALTCNSCHVEEGGRMDGVEDVEMEPLDD